MGDKERLDKVLASLGLGSRKEVRLLIRSGGICIDGQVCTSPEQKIDPAAQTIEAGGRILRYRRFYYLMMNKPAGYLSATRDRRDETVLSLVPAQYAHIALFPAGRLDRDSEGLLLLTNDGQTAHGLTSPARHVEKHYYVRYTGSLCEEAERLFAEGIAIDGGEVCRPARIERGAAGEAQVYISEGKYHQVKRMIAAAGAEVTYLRRLSIGPLVLDETLAPGQCRELDAQEETALLKAAAHAGKSTENQHG